MCKRAVVFSALLLFPSGLFADDTTRLLAQARSHRAKGNWYWAAESWQAILRQNPGHRASRRNLTEALQQSEKMTAAPSSDEQLYGKALNAFIILDLPKLQSLWAELEKEPRFAEEISWFREPPAAFLYTPVDDSAAWTSASDHFRRGWDAAEQGNLKLGRDLLSRAVTLQPWHFMAVALRDAFEPKPSKKNARSKHPHVDQATLLPGTPEEKWAKGETDYREGRWGEAVLWFCSAADDPDSTEPLRRKAQAAARRLEWMFPEDMERKMKRKTK